MNDASRPKMKLALSGIIFAASMIFASSAIADQVTLQSTDGTVNLTGDLVSFDGNIYVIRNDLGDLQIAANRVFCQGAACPVIEVGAIDVKLAGSDTIGEGLMPLMMGGFATFLNAEAKIGNTSTSGEFTASFIGDQGFGEPIGTYLVSATRSGDAFTSLMDKSAQIGMSSRRITPEEARALKAAGAGDMIDPSQEHIIAVDSLVVIVNRENPVTGLAITDLAKIYSGQVTNWSQVGGPDLPISVVTRSQDTGTFSVFRDAIFGTAEVATPPGATVAADNDAAAAFVNDNPGAIAFVGYAFQRGQKPLSLISECGIGTAPDPFSVKTEEYALFRRLYLYNRSDLANELATQFLNFTSSPEASTVIQQAGFIDLSIESIPQGPDSARAVSLSQIKTDSLEAAVIRDMLAAMTGSERLSSTFRFRTGSSQLDPRGQLDLERLATYLEAQPDGTRISFVGFSDEIGAFEPNRNLSIGRAQAVMAELATIAGDRIKHITMSATGFGEIAPSACNTTDGGRSINRRVETWVTRP